jgi:hypothetical protein
MFTFNRGHRPKVCKIAGNTVKMLLNASTCECDVDFTRSE